MLVLNKSESQNNFNRMHQNPSKVPSSNDNCPNPAHLRNFFSLNICRTKAFKDQLPIKETQTQPIGNFEDQNVQFERDESISPASSSRRQASSLKARMEEEKLECSSKDGALKKSSQAVYRSESNTSFESMTIWTDMQPSRISAFHFLQTRSS